MIQYNSFKLALLEAVESTVGTDHQHPDHTKALTKISELAEDHDGVLIDHIDDVVVAKIPVKNTDAFVKIVTAMGCVIYTDSDGEKDDNMVGVYLNPKIVMYASNDEDDDYDDDDELTEAKEVIRFDSKNKRTRKYRCSAGLKYDRRTGACAVITWTERNHRRRGAKHAIITKMRGGSGLKQRTANKIRKARTFRHNAGL